MHSLLRATLAKMVGYTTIVAVVMSYQAAKAESVWQITSTANQAAVGSSWPYPSGTSIQEDTTTPSAYALVDPPGVAYAEASSSYSISANQELIIESFSRASGDAYYEPGTGTWDGTHGAASTHLYIVQPVTRPTRIHFEGTFERSADTPQNLSSRVEIPGVGFYFESLSGAFTFDDTVDVMGGTFSLRVETGYNSGTYGGIHSGYCSASITVTMSTVPEPSTLTLLAVAALALVRSYARRRRH